MNFRLILSHFRGKASLFWVTTFHPQVGRPEGPSKGVGGGVDNSIAGNGREHPHPLNMELRGGEAFADLHFHFPFMLGIL